MVDGGNGLSKVVTPQQHFPVPPGEVRRSIISSACFGSTLWTPTSCMYVSPQEGAQKASWSDLQTTSNVAPLEEPAPSRCLSSSPNLYKASHPAEETHYSLYLRSHSFSHYLSPTEGWSVDWLLNQKLCLPALHFTLALKKTPRYSSSFTWHSGSPICLGGPGATESDNTAPRFTATNNPHLIMCWFMEGMNKTSSKMTRTMTYNPQSCLVVLPIKF